MGELHDSQRPSPGAGFQPAQTENYKELQHNRGPVLRIPRAVVILALALFIISFALLSFWLIGNSSERSRFYFFGGLLSFFAITLAIFSVIVMRKRSAVNHWACAAATVVESAAVWGVTSSGGRTARTWLPHFTYQYEAAGQVYRSSRIAFYRRCTGSCAQELVARHPVGSLVQVYYDPACPREAVLDRSFRAPWLLPLFALVCGALAVVFFQLPDLLAV